MNAFAEATMVVAAIILLCGIWSLLDLVFKLLKWLPWILGITKEEPKG